LKIIQTKHFGRQKKKLNAHQIRDLDKAILTLIENPEAGEQKRGDLSTIRVYKFRLLGQLCLLAYTYEPDGKSLCLYAVGPHENFYRDLKRSID
jgi:mRNA-degrading endonuclease RelE of RelBE toxin-antitoxin system